MNYKQCRLKQNNTYKICWIPENLAEVGKVIKVKKEEGLWEVVTVSPRLLSEGNIIKPRWKNNI